ncbi:hypothetical protein ONZ45_g9859 [Pleurotus djamor]|nr:hypothetical protein ONZ45_g9859 [Pleurotus djamor]
MPYIRRLYIDPTSNHVLQSVLDALPRSVGLTHLSVPALKVMRTHVLVDMRLTLERHRSTLRFISCKDNASYLTKYLNSPMKVLDTVNNDHPSDWGTLIDFAPIKYLSTAILPACIKDPRSVFFNIVALKISRLASHDVLPMYAPHLVRVRILHLGVVDVGSTSAEINIRDLMGIPSPFLSYIHICRLENSPNRSEAEGPALPFAQLFDRHLSLRAVDVTHAIKDMRKGPCFRHVRGSEATKEVNIHPTGPSFYAPASKPVSLMYSMLAPSTTYQPNVTTRCEDHVLVSHATYQMIVPAMYECILVDDKEFNKDEAVKKGYGPCTSISPSRLPQLTDALKQNPKLAKYNTRLILEQPFPSTADRSFKLDIFQTIHHLRCLQRLCIATYSRAETHILWRLLPDYLRSSSIALTHLSVTSLNNPTITNTLEACSSSLRFLSSKNNAGPESMYLPASLGALETLDVGYTLDREGVVKISGSPMRHLFILALTSFSAIAHPQDLFANLTTLKARLILAGALPRFAPYLKNLRMLHVTAINADDTEVSVQFPSG